MGRADPTSGAFPSAAISATLRPPQSPPMSIRTLLTSTCLVSLAFALGGCGGSLPKSAGVRASGQSGLMNESFAAKNACNPKNHLRPFIIEWDATDRSSFEAHAANDVVVVRYEGCEMTILEECRNDSVRGSQGAYRPVEWTSGALEKLNISNEGELYAKLPLSVGTLGGRVQGGEKFGMEYYVSGTRNSTRDAVYREDIASNPGCEGATHFVYGYNLGAFAMGSAANLDAEVGGSLYGFGAGAKTSKKRQADKQGGDLATCKSDEAREVEGCKSPIRLTLRPIRDGANPEKAAMKAEDTSDSLNAAGMVNMKLEMSELARAHYDAATAKQSSRDGKGCVSELDQYDKLEPKRKSTDPKQGVSMTRAMCLMIAGKCDAGKALLRKSYENTATMVNLGPEMLDKQVEHMASLNCQGKLAPRDELLQGFMELSMGANIAKRKPEECEAAYAKVKKNRDAVKPKDDEDHQVIAATRDLYAIAPGCFARAGDCKRAWTIFKDTYPQERLAQVKDPAQHENIIKSTFEAVVPKCKG